MFGTNQWLMGENGLEFIFGETVKELAIEQSENNTRKNNRNHSKNLTMPLAFIVFLVSAMFSYSF